MLVSVIDLNQTQTKYDTIFWTKCLSTIPPVNVVYYGSHLEFRLSVWCGNVGSGATELPDPENMIL